MGHRRRLRLIFKMNEHHVDERDAATLLQASGDFLECVRVGRINHHRNAMNGSLRAAKLDARDAGNLVHGFPEVFGVILKRDHDAGDHIAVSSGCASAVLTDFTLQFQICNSTFLGMISSTATYALRAAAYLANQPDRYVNRAEISEATAVPHEYLLKVLNQLDAAEIVTSRRGPGGGYRLRRPASEITSLEVVLAVDSIPRITECPLGIKDHRQLCPLDQLLDNAASQLEAALAQTKLSDLLPKKKPKKKARTCDFPKISTSH